MWVIMRHFHAITIVCLAVFASLLPPAYSRCDPTATVLEQNFNGFNGTYQNMTVDLVKQLFPHGEARPSSDPTHQNDLTPGHVFDSGLERLQIGNGQLRIQHPAGMLAILRLLLLQPRSTRYCRSTGPLSNLIPSSQFGFSPRIQLGVFYSASAFYEYSTKHHHKNGFQSCL
jgi:hypothetical protein